MQPNSLALTQDVLKEVPQVVTDAPEQDFELASDIFAPHHSTLQSDHCSPHLPFISLPLYLT